MANASNTKYRALSGDEVRQLAAQSCTAEDWGRVRVAEPFAAERVSQVDFAGEVLALAQDAGPGVAAAVAEFREFQRDQGKMADIGAQRFRILAGLQLDYRGMR
jgi:hypothetical protein